MLETQAERLIERLKSACTYHRFDEPRVHAEYIRFLMRHDFERMEDAIDLAIEDDSRNVPAISVLVKKYREIKECSRNTAVVQNEEYCAVCDDKGYVLMKEKHKEFTFNGKPIVYEYVLYCQFCKVGRSQAYDGRNISKKEHQSRYRVPPLTEYFGDEGVQMLREANLKKRAENSEVERPVQKALQAVGKSVPDGWQYDMDSELPF